MYHISFLFSNKLHKHLCVNCYYSKFATSDNSRTMMKITSDLTNKKTISESVIKKMSLSQFSLIIYIKFIITNELSSDYRFWDWHYVTVKTKLLFDFTKTTQSICLNTDCIITFINRQFLIEQVSQIMTHYMMLLIFVWEFRTTIHNSNWYIKIDIYLTNIDDCITVITHKTHIVNNLWVKMLIEIDVLVTKNIIINLLQKVVVIDSCVNIKISLTITTKSIS